VFLTVIGNGRDSTTYKSGSGDVFDKAPPIDNEIPDSLCHKCVSFIKEWECKTGELRAKGARVKLYNCEKFFSKDNVERTVEHAA
jgi:hypothetical protein